jgi:hypothetical protein
LLSRAFNSNLTASTMSQASKPSPIDKLNAAQREVLTSIRNGMRPAITRAAAKLSVVIACAKLLERRGMVEEGPGLGANSYASDRATRCRRIRLRLSCQPVAVYRKGESVRRVKTKTLGIRVVAQMLIPLLQLHNFDCSRCRLSLVLFVERHCF